MPGARLAGMSNDVRLRNVEEPDLEVFFEHQLDPEAARLASFPSRDGERFLTHWKTKVLETPPSSCRPSPLTANRPAAWWPGDTRTGASSATGSDAGTGGEASAPEQ